MPRKGHHYYDEDVDYDDYDYDDYEEEEEDQYDNGSTVRGSSSSSAAAPTGSWACGICTFENIEQMTACEMCGGFRNSELQDPFKFDSLSPDDRILGAQRNKTVASRAITDSQTSVPNVAEAAESPKPKLVHETIEPPRPKPKMIVHEATEPKRPKPKIVPEAKAKIVHEASEAPRLSTKAESLKATKSNEPVKLSELENSLGNSSLESSDGKGTCYQAKYKGLPLESYKPEPWMLQGVKGVDKHLLHLVVVGHVDAGKSTLMGRILHTVGRVSQKEMRKNQKEATEMGKGSFAYAWALDEGSEERARGVTITVAVAHFETPKLRVVLLDAPGHKDFVPNMISGAAQADAAVLVVDASTGGFEAGMQADGRGSGQTREHALLARSLGVNQLVVAVNKMDMVNYSQHRFEEIRGTLGPFLHQCNFRDAMVTWVPVSASDGQNLSVTPTDHLFSSWYKGPTLLEALDKFEPPPRDVSKPFRLAIAEVVRTRTLGATGVGGKIEAGAIKIGSKVMVMPCREVAIVKSLEHDGQPRQVARAGDSVDIGLQGVDTGTIVPGGVLCHPDYLVPVATRIELRIMTFKLATPILRGSQVVMYAHHAKEPASVSDLTSSLDPKNGQVTKRAPRCLTSNQHALVELIPERAICVEEYSKFRALGRVVLRSGGNTLAVGIVTRIISQQQA